MFMHAQSNRMLGNYEEAARLFEQSVELNRKIHDKGMVAAELSNLGFVEIHRGNTDAAERWLNKSANMALPLDNPYFRAMTLLTRAAVAFLQGDEAKARTLQTESEKTLKDSKLELGRDDKFEFDWLKEKLSSSTQS